MNNLKQSEKHLEYIDFGRIKSNGINLNIYLIKNKP